MPKMKSHSGAKKRFKVTAGGKIKRRGAYHTHILTKKDPKRKRRLRRQAIVKTRGEVKTLKRLLQA
jgi:large subunit ribosomal protein L35